MRRGKRVVRVKRVGGETLLGEAADDCADGKRMEADFRTCNPVLKTTWGNVIRSNRRPGGSGSGQNAVWKRVESR